jgi:hypothetical protein
MQPPWHDLWWIAVFAAVTIVVLVLAVCASSG